VAGAITVADYFGKRFNSQRVQTAAGITIIFGLGGYLLAVTQGTAFLLTHITDLTFTQGLIISWVSYTAFTMYSGTRGVILTDTLMFLLFTSVAMLALIFLVQDAGGWIAAVKGLAQVPEKPDLMAWHGMVGEDTPFSSVLHFTLWNITLALAWGMVYAVSPWQSSRYLIARDEHVVIFSDPDGTDPVCRRRRDQPQRSRHPTFGRGDDLCRNEPAAGTVGSAVTCRHNGRRLVLSLDISVAGGIQRQQRPVPP
jgi:Na+/pantothenate symporter